MSRSAHHTCFKVREGAEPEALGDRTHTDFSGPKAAAALQPGVCLGHRGPALLSPVPAVDEQGYCFSA